MRQFCKPAILKKALAFAWAIAFRKWSVWVKNKKCEKDVKNHSTRLLELFCAKKPLEKNTKYWGIEIIF